MTEHEILEQLFVLAAETELAETNEHKADLADEMALLLHDLHAKLEQAQDDPAAMYHSDVTPKGL